MSQLSSLALHASKQGSPSSQATWKQDLGLELRPENDPVSNHDSSTTPCHSMRPPGRCPLGRSTQAALWPSLTVPAMLGLSAINDTISFVVC